MTDTMRRSIRTYFLKRPKLRERPPAAGEDVLRKTRLDAETRVPLGHGASRKRAIPADDSEEPALDADDRRDTFDRALPLDRMFR